LRISKTGLFCYRIILVKTGVNHEVPLLNVKYLSAWQIFILFESNFFTINYNDKNYGNEKHITTMKMMMVLTAPGFLKCMAWAQHRHAFSGSNRKDG